MLLESPSRLLTSNINTISLVNTLQFPPCEQSHLTHLVLKTKKEMKQKYQ